MKKNKLSNIEIAEFTNQLSLTLHAGISIFEGISIMRDDINETNHFIHSIYKDMDNGKSFSEALQNTEMFPDYTISMINIGEETGRLEEILTRLSKHYQRLHENNENINAALSYPMIMIAMMAVVVIVLITQVLPIFNHVFQSLGTSINAFSLFVLTLGKTLARYSWVFIVLLFLLVGYVVYVKNSEKGKLKLYRFLTHFPPTRDLLMKMALSHFTSGLAIALSSGMTIEESIDLSKELVKNHELLSLRINKAQDIMKEKDIVSALTETHILSGMYARFIKIGYRTGGMETIFDNIATRYEKETNDRISRLIGIIEPSLVAILSIITGIILLSVMLPLIGIMSSL
ncbi:type IV pilus assembly protein PilC [Kandleria vitulina]|uniref:Type IV pilus assembly protein PilC n=1 Tax=Kandleria vitulina TaxID=1630 RepID=A0A1H2VPR9_9FIRM|nr:type II secretion system F family protein [Kandleria vitulina]SDW70355.1 type IV pilus assembly protein PilC [Kandleria vitulina]HAD22909.1 type II secretion system F family protein [Kandleria vitulina]HBG68389.1 type II secretion system F family protein [Kandleria vitulina]HCY52540.1 type II secretion system F family protein [Kandleria vitulina]